MKKCIAKFLSLIAVALFAPSTFAATDSVARTESYPWMSLAQWYRFHADDVEVAEKGETDLLFVGDSITEGWGGNGAKVWDQAFGKHNPANFGIGGDTTSSVLWRLKHGAVGKLSPRVIVLMIGTNNFWFNKDDPDAVVKGIAAVIKLLRESFPESKILVLEVFPRDELSSGESRLKAEEVNENLPAMADNKHIFVKDIGGAFLETDGSISRAIMPDFLHLSLEGYQRWAKAILPTIKPWLEEKAER